MASSPDINQFNASWRGSPLYRDTLRGMGIDPAKPVKLTDTQRKTLQSTLERSGVTFPSGVEIDAAGNMNENEGLGKQVKKWGPLVAAGTLAAFGIPGLFPGLIGGGGAAAGAAGTAAAGATAAGTTAAAGTAAATVGGSALGLSSAAWLDLAIFGGSTVADIFSSRSAAKAADRGAQAQLQSNREALSLLREQWVQEVKDFAPYLATGQAAIAKIGQNLQSQAPPTLPSHVSRGAVAPAPVTPPPAPAPRPPVAPMSVFGQTAPVPPPAAPGGPMAPPVATTMPMGGPGAVREPMALPPRPPAAPTGTAAAFGTVSPDQTVRMQIGSVVKDVPAAFVEQWKARGAQVVAA